MKRNSAQMPEYSSANHFKHTHPNRLFRAAIARFNARLLELADSAAPETVLDVGCGEGFVLQHLAEHRPAWRLTGCDRAGNAIAYASHHCPTAVSLYVADIHHLPMASRSFDLVLSSEVLEHLEDVQGALAELQRVARGHVLITVPHEPLFRILARLAVWLRLGPDPAHRHFWTASGFRRLMRAHFGRVAFAYSSQYQLALGQRGIGIP